MIIHNIISLVILDNYSLLATFENGKRKRYDMKPLIEEIKALQPLKTVKGLFQKAHLSPQGYGVIWNDDIDIDSYIIYKEGVEV